MSKRRKYRPLFPRKMIAHRMFLTSRGSRAMVKVFDGGEAKGTARIAMEVLWDDDPTPADKVEVERECELFMRKINPRAEMKAVTIEDDNEREMTIDAHFRGDDVAGFGGVN